jgi:ATP-dependent helicase/nuclease subunit A
LDQHPEKVALESQIESATITTIHSFCSSLVRRYAVPMGVDPAFTALDPSIANAVLVEAVAETLRAILLDSSSVHHEGLKQLIVLYGYAQVCTAMESLVAEADVPKWRAFVKRNAKSIADQWRNEEYTAVVRARAQHLFQYNRAIRICVPLLQDNLGEFRGVARTRAQALLEMLPQLPKMALDHDWLKNLHDQAIVKGTKASDWGGEDVYAQIKDSLEELRSVLKKQFLEAFTADQTEDVLAAAEVGQTAIRIALEAEQLYHQRKRNRAGIDFSDMISFTRKFLEENPEECHALRQEFPVILVDECQDTDPAQDAIVRAILGEHLPTADLFAVGDVKQSIYRFRGAEVELFRALAKDVSANQSLLVNYRSAPEILEFVNHVFSRAIPEYEGLLAGKTEQKGEVELLLVPVDKTAGEGKIEREAEALAARIVQLRQEYPGAESQGVTILLKRMSHVGTYERALEKAGLEFYTVGGRAFFAQQEVYDVLNLLQTIENPLDHLALVGVLRSPFGGLSDDAVHLLASHPEGVWAGMNDRLRLTQMAAQEADLVVQLRETLHTLRVEKDRSSIRTLFGRLLDLTGYDGSLQVEPLADRKLANLWKIMELARPFDAAGMGLPAFIHELQDRISRESREEQAATTPEESGDADVIRIMTIHQAKGLEFRTVFVPDLNAPSYGPSNIPVVRWDQRMGGIPKLPTDVDETDEDRPFSPLPHEIAKATDAMADYQEALRVFYVACTRAVTRLILSTAYDSDTLTPVSAAMDALSAAYDLETGLPIRSASAPVLLRPEPLPLKPVHTPSRTPTVATPQPLPELSPSGQALEIRLEVLEGRAPHTPLPPPSDLAGAKRLFTNVSFSYPVKNTVVVGVVDWLWEDEQGWHLGVANETPATKRIPGLRLAAEALRQSSGLSTTTLRVWDTQNQTWKQAPTDSITLASAETYLIPG